MPQKTVLVLGGSYFIGLAIVKELADCGYKVYTLNRGNRKNTDSRVTNIVCDRCRKELLNTVLRDLAPEYVVDVSGLSGLHAELVCNALNTSRLEALIYISSSAVYSVDELTIPFRESDKLGENPYWLEYGTGKLDAEVVYMRFLRKRKIRGVFLRPPYIYGENNYAQRESFMFEHALSGRIILVPENDPLLHFCYAPDLAMLTACFLERDDLSGVGIYNVGDSFAVRAVEWVDLCAEAIKRPVRIIRYNYKSAGRRVRDFFPFNDYDNVLDVTAVKQLYGIETPLDKGLAATARWYESVRGSIAFNPFVAENEKAILKELGIDEKA